MLFLVIGIGIHPKIIIASKEAFGRIVDTDEVVRCILN